ncbi:MAG: N-methyl-L-tryptophan oxidase [Chloroflexota bacterium]
MAGGGTALDLVVVGGGVFGLGTAWEAAERGWRVVVLEQGPIPNRVAASFGPSRKIRSTYTDVHYAALAREAMAAWRELMDRTGQDLMVPAGNLVYTTLAEQPRIDELEEVSREIGASIEMLDASQLASRYPQFLRARRALLETDAGFLRASACVETLRDLAESAGATVRTEQPVAAIEPNGGSVTVMLDGGERVTAARAVIAAGGWTQRLVPTLGSTLTQSQQGIMYVANTPAAFDYPAFPAFSSPDAGFYGFPAYRGDAFKVAQHVLGVPIASPDFDRSTAPEGFDAAAREFLADYLGLDPATTPVRAESCMYNLTPSSDFLIDFLPGHPNVLVATGGSGHGFKFGSIIGKVAIDRLAGVSSARWSEQFGWTSVTTAAQIDRPR